MPKSGYITSQNLFKSCVHGGLPSPLEEPPIQDGRFKNPFHETVITWNEAAVCLSVSRVVTILKKNYNFYVSNELQPRIDIRYYTSPPLYSNLAKISDLEEIPASPLLYREPENNKFSRAQAPLLLSLLGAPPYKEIETKKLSFFQKIWRKEDNKNEAARKLEFCEKSIRKYQELLYVQALKEKLLWEKLISNIRARKNDADHTINALTGFNLFKSLQPQLNAGVRDINRTESKLDSLIIQRFSIINTTIDGAKKDLESLNRKLTQKIEEKNLILETEEASLDEKDSLIPAVRRNKKMNRLQQEIDHLSQCKISLEDLIAFLLLKKIQPYPFENTAVQPIKDGPHPSLILPTFTEPLPSL